MAYSQKEEKPSFSIFKKGTWNFNLNEKLDYKTGRFMYSDRSQSFSTSLEANYFVINHLGIGLGVSAFSDNFSYNDGGPIETWKNEIVSGHVNLLFGTRIGGPVNLTVKATAGLGFKNYYSSYDGSGFIDDYRFYYFKFLAGFPVRIDRNIFFTPSAGYAYQKTDKTLIEKKGGAYVDLLFEFYLPCEDARWEFSNARVPVANRFEKGEIHIGSAMIGNLQAGSSEYTYSPEDGWDRYLFTSVNLTGYALYYIYDNFAIGLTADFWLNRENPEETLPTDEDYISQETEFLAGPVIRMHMPIDNMWRNLYGETSISVGKHYKRTVNDDDVFRYDEGSFDIKVGLGYEFYISERFSLNPMGGFEFMGTDETRYNWNCLYLGIGWNYHLR